MRINCSDIALTLSWTLTAIGKISLPNFLCGDSKIFGITSNVESRVQERRRSKNWLCPQLGNARAHSDSQLLKRKVTYRTSVLKRFRPGRARFELESGRYLAAACRVACQMLRPDKARASTAARRRQLKPEADRGN